MTDCDSILEHKLALCKSISEGLLRQLKLKLKILAIEEALTGGNIAPGAPAQAVGGRVLAATGNTDDVGFYEDGYFYIQSERFQQIANMLHVSRSRVLREMAGLGCSAFKRAAIRILHTRFSATASAAATS